MDAITYEQMNSILTQKIMMRWQWRANEAVYCLLFDGQARTPIGCGCPSAVAVRRSSFLLGATWEQPQREDFRVAMYSIFRYIAYIYMTTENLEMTCFCPKSVTTQPAD